MRRISTGTKAVDKFGAGKDGFTNGNAVAGIPATDLEEGWFDHVQEELAGIVEGAGIALDAGNRSQVSAALRSGANIYAPDAGIANICALSYVPAITVLNNGMVLRFKAAASNTGPTSISIDALGSNPIKGLNNSDLQGGEIVAGRLCSIVWNANIATWILLECTGGALQIPTNSYGSTPPQFDSSTKLATMAALQSAGLHFNGGVSGINANTQLTLAQAGKVFEVTTPGVTVTLPVPSAGSGGLCSYTFKAVVSFILKADGVNTIGYGSTSGNTYSVLAGETLTVIASGLGGSWYVVLDGFGASTFGGVIAKPGYQKLPGGLIRQWDVVLVAASAITTFNLPIAFPNMFFGANATGQQASVSAAQTPSIQAEPIGLTQIKIQNTYSGSALLIFYEAIGR